LAGRTEVAGAGLKAAVARLPVVGWTVVAVWPGADPDTGIDPEGGATTIPNSVAGAVPVAASRPTPGMVASETVGVRPVAFSAPGAGITESAAATTAPAPDTVPLAGATFELLLGANPVVRWLPAAGVAASAAATPVDPERADAPMAADEIPKAAIRYGT